MRKTVSAPEFAHFHDEWHLSPGLDADDFIFFSGVTGCHPDDAVAEDPRYASPGCISVF